MKKRTYRLKSTLLALLALAFISSCANISNANSVQTPAPKEKKDPYHVKSVQQGKASWYSVKTNYGTATASGERFSNSAATAAHKTLPMGTKVRVTNLNNNKSEIVRINDRGPYIKGRIIDVSIGTAEKLGFVTRGVVPIKVEVLGEKKHHHPVASKEP
ncbi:MAG: septal ring lytic transglycosylase RlpA family protein [Luteolibacter sp.]